MGYDYFFQQCARQLLLSILISIESPLQILIFEIFVIIIFINAAPNRLGGARKVPLQVLILILKYYLGCNILYIPM
jgi:hypothetical protein